VYLVIDENKTKDILHRHFLESKGQLKFAIRLKFTSVAHLVIEENKVKDILPNYLQEQKEINLVTQISLLWVHHH
jgi:hypothetical protein